MYWWRINFKLTLTTLEQDLLNLQEADRQKQTELKRTQEALKQAHSD